MEMFQEFDINKDGNISFDEFELIMQKAKGQKCCGGKGKNKTVSFEKEQEKD